MAYRVVAVLLVMLGLALFAPKDKPAAAGLIGDIVSMDTNDKTARIIHLLEKIEANTRREPK